MGQVLNDAQTATKYESPGQVVLVLQGVGRSAPFKLASTKLLHESGIEPDWVIGTSIGALNGAIIAGNPIERRMGCLRKLWALIEQENFAASQFWPGVGSSITTLETLLRGIPRLLSPNPDAAWGPHALVGAERAAFYSTTPLRSTLLELVDIEHLPLSSTRLTMGAVNIRNGCITSIAGT